MTVLVPVYNDAASLRSNFPTLVDYLRQQDWSSLAADFATAL